MVESAKGLICLELVLGDKSIKESPLLLITPAEIGQLISAYKLSFLLVDLLQQVMSLLLTAYFICQPVDFILDSFLILVKLIICGEVSSLFIVDDAETLAPF